MAMNIDAAVNISAGVQGQQAVDKLSESLKRLGDTGTMSAKQIQQEMRWLPKQFDDLFRQIAAGQSPMQALYMQGSQLRDMFGGIGPAVRAVGTYLGGMLTPLNIGIAALGAFGFAAYKGADQSSELKKQLLLTGGAAGYTAGQIEQMANKLSETADIAIGTARDLTTGLAGSGQFVGKNLNEAADAAAKLQKLTGQSSDEIVKDFAKMSSGVAAWAAEHNKQFNYLSLAQFQHIKQLEEMGRKEEAMRENIEALDKAMEGRKRNLGYLEKAWKALGDAASWAWDKMLGLGRDKEPEDEVAKLTKYIAAREQLLKSDPNVKLNIAAQTSWGKQFDKELSEAKARLAELQKVTDKAQQEATDKAEAAAKIRQKIEEEQSGKANALRAANIQLELTKLQGASEARIAILEQEGQRVENQYRAGLLTEEKYNSEKLRIAKAVLNERMKLSEQEIALEKKRKPNGPADDVIKQAKIQALRNQLAQTNAEAIQAELKAEGERAAFLKKMDDELLKFSNTQSDHISKIIAEANAVDMSTLEYKKYNEALRIDKEATAAMIGKSPKAQEAIRKQADAFKEATAAALDYADQKAKSFETGTKAAMKEYVENSANSANQAKTFFTNAFQGMEDAMVNFVKTGKLNFSSLADSIISDMIRIMVQKQIMGPMMSSFGNMFGSGGGSDGAGLMAELQAIGVFANGGIMTSRGELPLNAYASGGIANRPQLALFGEGRTPEAFVPLPDGRHIPVAMQGGGGSSVVVNVVNNASNAKASAQERTDSNGQRIIDVMIEQVKASIASDISRGVGTVTSALERTYGSNRAAGAY